MEFTVINSDVGRFSRDDDNHNDSGASSTRKFEDVSCLDLSCSNILHIANLCLISSTNLTSLKLPVNRIDKICNLDAYTNLVELDLSHNHIKQIENLQGLVKLRRLTLNHNPLTNVQNLDTQRNCLEMLDIGYCKIADYKFTLYLRKFTNLISLIVEGNPWQTEPIYSERTFILSIVQSLLVYNNKTITVEERKEALDTHSQLIAMLEKNDNKWKRMSVDEQLRLERMAGRKDAFLDGIPEGEDVDFNVNVFRNTTVEQVLIENSRYGIHNVYRGYADSFRRLITEITEAAETSRGIRARLVDEFHCDLRQLIDGGVDESRKCVSEFAEYKKRVKCDLSAGTGDGVSPSTNADSACGRFGEKTRLTWLTLMGHEDQLSRKITKMIGELRDVLEKQIVEFKQLVNNRFCMLQRQQNIFLQFILEYAVSSVQSDDINNRISRVSQFTNDISQCMESQASQVERAELYITKSASKWLDDVFDKLNSEEFQRNRRKISEIASFIRSQNETLKRTQS
ncbi:dynein regulatory complex subunit 3-like [Acyrthosiphon pisum]|uniref:Dynein axonemal assembly factor 1 homolog n=1 Tax=Acyrthosiphon pisum TaxID=7029 RepID=A0A8R2NKM1_ACYPI|nr:dynein regulatory complex subunit 3-like [Acyrthosiphon pisum]XP_029342140.1 dynein regulatory complex subunit 3-like [Acyrthosiphon pisum]XP_029342142.1 dynein regulatory complex subunit 3-like [Acyrthosiphon pisum]|eukprot:XP_003247599.1 PREDICTED: dynein regulatory complex subunit 3-like isoform X1 [Acyrthosiphon pisum]